MRGRLFLPSSAFIVTITASVAVFAALAAAQRGAAPASAAVALERFTVQSDGHPIAVWARRPAGPRGAILLVHGMTWSARPDFDLQVPGLQRSVMSSFAAQGFAAYGVDLRGYGETARDATGWATPRRSATDVLNVLTWIAGRHPTLPKPALVGWSRGGAISMMAVQMAPARASALVTFGFLFDPEAQFADVPAPAKPLMEKNTAEAAASDFISLAVTPPSVVRAFVEQALKTDPVRIDLKNDVEYNFLKPAGVTVPTLILYGQQDPGVSDDDAGKFFAKLAAARREMVVLPGADHAAQLEDTHDMWISAIVSFLNRPPVRR